MKELYFKIYELLKSVRNFSIDRFNEENNYIKQLNLAKNNRLGGLKESVKPKALQVG